MSFRPLFRSALSRQDINECLDLLFDGYGLATMTGDLSDKQQIALRNDVLFRVLVYTGMRRAEATALREWDWDSANRTLLIRRGKGGKERVAVLADKTNTSRDLINELMRWHDSTWLIPSSRRGWRSKLVDNRPLSENSVYNIIRGIGTQAGMTRRLRPHDLRRTFITQALEGGASIADVMAQVGHARAETTLRYAQAVEAASRWQRISF